jgi:uncharacterized protein YegP (UPF0339 family)
MPKGIYKRRKKHFDRIHIQIIRNKARNQQFRWRIVSCNGNILCHSEHYNAKLGPEKTINSIITAILKGQYRIENIDEQGD